MEWIGKWKNQFGSFIDITKQEDGKAQGTFASAVDKTTKDQLLPVIGVYKGNLKAVTYVGSDHVVTYAGMYYQDKLETVWQVISDTVINAKKKGKIATMHPLAWWQSVKTNKALFTSLSKPYAI